MGFYTFKLNIPSSAFDRLKDTITYDVINRYSDRKLIKLLFDFIRYNRPFLKYEFNIHYEFVGNYLDLQKTIEIDSNELTLSEIPGVLIHECLHGLFDDLEEDSILLLEKRILTNMTIGQINKLLHEVLVHGRWEYRGPKDRYRKPGDNKFSQKARIQRPRNKKTRNSSLPGNKSSKKKRIRKSR